MSFENDETFIDLDEKPPIKFSTSFSNSYKSFNDMSDKQKRNVTASLISFIEKFIESNEFDMTTNQLLGYLLLRENKKSCAELG